MRLNLSILILILFAHPLTASDIIPASITNRIGKPKIIRGKFKQVKKIKILKRPLKSKGTFLLSSKEGLYWQQTSPFNALTILNKKQLIQIVNDGKKQVVNAKDQPMVFAFSNLFLSIFKGDFRPVLDEFEVKILSDNSNAPWQIKLFPRNKPLNKAIAEIYISGDTMVTKFVLVEKNGDTLNIEFSNFILDTPLSNNEIKQYHP